MHKPVVIGLTIGLAVATLIIVWAIVVRDTAGRAASSTSSSPSTYASAKELHDRLSGTEAACQPLTPTQPLHDATDAASCRIRGAMATLSVYGSKEAVERELKTFSGRGGGRYKGWYIARLAGENWMVAVGGPDADPVRAAADAAKAVLGGELDLKDW
ncbi:hypothetical protein GCM10010149_88100 [Nonomuraea roseoviolacea subsp. roseoviolacea]|uniref:hypothetical protein n=1 Tax=Nonomuraea roseoviolacea TaxID=103837 RepID=UPI0031D44177